VPPSPRSFKERVPRVSPVAVRIVRSNKLVLSVVDTGSDAGAGAVASGVVGDVVGDVEGEQAAKVQIEPISSAVLRLFIIGFH
jgi:hypothetical protein